MPPFKIVAPDTSAVCACSDPLVLKHFSIGPDIIHLDAAHDFEAVTTDLHIWWPFLKPDGLLIGGDYYEETHWPGVKRAFDEYFSPQRLLPLKNINGKCKIRKRLDIN